MRHLGGAGKGRIMSANTIRHNEGRGGAMRVSIRTFGGFEAKVAGVALTFERAKAKELLALLVDQHGNAMSTRRACETLWEDRPYGKGVASYFRIVASSLRRTLEEAGASGVMVKRHNGVAIAPERIDCDAWRLLEGSAPEPYMIGTRYLAEYHWADYSPLSAAVHRTQNSFVALDADDAGEGQAVGEGRGGGSLFAFMPCTPASRQAAARVRTETACDATHLPDLARRVTEAYYRKNYQTFLDLVEQDALFIGIGRNVALNYDELQAACSADVDMPQFRMENADFRLSLFDAHTSNALGVACVTGFFDLYSELDHGMMTAMKQRITIIARWTQAGWRVRYLHASNEWSELMGLETFPVQASRQTFEYLQWALKRGIEAVQRTCSIPVKVKGRSYMVNPLRLMWAKALGKRSLMHFDDHEAEIDCALGELETQLPEGKFMRVHRSFLANIDKAIALDVGCLRMADGSAVPVPSSRICEVRERLPKWL